MVVLIVQFSMVNSFERLMFASKETVCKRKMADLAYKRILMRRCIVAWRQYIYQRTLQMAYDHFIVQNNRKLLQSV